MVVVVVVVLSEAENDESILPTRPVEASLRVYWVRCFEGETYYDLVDVARVCRIQVFFFKTRYGFVVCIRTVYCETLTSCIFIPIL